MFAFAHNAPKKQCFFGDPAEARGSPDKKTQEVYQGYSKVIRMAQSAIGYRTASPIGRRRAAIGYRRKGDEARGIRMVFGVKDIETK